MPILRIRAGSGKELTYRLPNAPVQIGRSPSCQIRLAGDRVSRHHAQVEPTCEGFVVSDLESGNGTFVNGERIQRVLLAQGDEFTVAGVTFVFDKGEAAEPEAPAEAAAPGAGGTGVPPVDAAVDQQAVQNMKIAADAIRAEVGKIIVGQAEVLDQVLAAMLARGHCLMVGVPGLAKTLLVRTISQILDLDFKRVQFTPDLMPSDITGTDILEVDEATGRGPARPLPLPRASRAAGRAAPRVWPPSPSWRSRLSLGLSSPSGLAARGARPPRHRSPPPRRRPRPSPRWGPTCRQAPRRRWRQSWRTCEASAGS